MISFPLLSALYRMGASIGVVVTWLISWEVLGLSRIFIWDIPLMGVKFTMLYLSVSFFTPVLAGMLAQKVAHFFDVVIPSKGDP